MTLQGSQGEGENLEDRVKEVGRISYNPKV